MCRVLSYLGDHILIEELLYMTDNSFIKQSYNPKYMTRLLNLAGFGLVAWDNTSHNAKFPYIYKTTELPFYDKNLRNIAAKIQANCFLTHIRGVAYTEKQVVSQENVHPFIFNGNNRFALAHNGSLFEFQKIKYDLLDYIHPKFAKEIQGTTDSEWIYALFLSQLNEELEKPTADRIIDAVIRTLKILQSIRAHHQIAITSPVNLFISNGEFLAAVRFVLDYGWNPQGKETDEHLVYHSLWYTYGEGYGLYDHSYRVKEGANRRCIIVASEPLTTDITTWVELPEYTILVAWREDDEIKIMSQDIIL